MIRWTRRLVLLGSLALVVSIVATACSNPTAPRLPEAEEEQDSVPPEVG